VSQEELQEVVVCALLDVQEMRGIAQAALEESVALVSLHEVPPAGSFVLELHAPGSRPVVLLAEAAGEETDGVLPLLLKPFDDEHYGELLAFVCGHVSMAPPPATRWTLDIPRSESTPRFDTQPGVGSSGREPPNKHETPAPGPDPLLGRGLAGGKYVIEALLGEGSWGAVYKARHVALDLSLAIKVLHPRFRADGSFAKRFIAEARAASRIDHPNVARVQDFGEEPDGLLYIVMELLRGIDLRELLNQQHLPRERRMEILASVLRALSVADDHGIVHRDIKPENVVVVRGKNEDGDEVDVVKVCDFGLATVKPRSSGTTGATDVRRAAASMSFVAGTPEYMSPEQIVGEEVDIRADLYACGVMMYELLTGRRPFAGKSIVDLLRQQLYEQPASPRSIDPTIDTRLEALVLRALAKERDKRPPSPREFREELKAAMRPRARTTESAITTPRVGLGDFLASLLASLVRPPLARRDRLNADARLTSNADAALHGRGAITITRLAPNDAGSWVVLSGGVTTTLGATMRERSVTGQTESGAMKMAHLLEHRGVASITLVEGAPREELSDVVALLADPAIPPDDLGPAIAERRAGFVAVLLDGELVGHARSLPWAVDLCMSRLALWIGGLGAPPDADAAYLSMLRAKLVADEVGALGRDADALRRLLDHADLLAEAMKHVPELQGAEPMTVIVNALDVDKSIAVASAYLDEADRTGSLAPRALVAVRLVGLRLLPEKSPAVTDLLGRLARRSVLSAAELPPELQGSAMAVQTAQRLIEDEAGVLAELASAPTQRALAARLRALAPAIPILVERGAIGTLGALGRALLKAQARSSAMSSGPTRSVTQTGFGAGEDESPRDLAAKALGSMRDGALQARLAERLVAGPVPHEDALRDLFVLAGPVAASALVDARLRPGADGNRTGFVAALRAIGPAGVPAVARAIGALSEAHDGGEAGALEDLLRALPDGPMTDLAQASKALAHHGAAGVRRAIVARMPDILGPASRPALRVAARDLDDGVRIAAFGALRRIGAIDGGVIALARGLLTGGAQASNELRLVAAAALGEVGFEHRAEAIELLREALRPRSRSLISVLRMAEGAQEDPALVETLARSLILIGGEEGRREVERRAAASRPEVRERLETLLR
jgi:serine/threonine-protein kinase